MKAISVLLVAVVGVSARGETVPDLMPRQVEALTPIDSLPDRAHLDAVFGSRTEALAKLSEVALADDGAVDFGVQLRAIRALTTYCPELPAPCGAGTTTHDTLATIIDAHGDESPRAILKLRAAIEALGISGRSAALDEDVDRLTEFLAHPSRDIRAATAKALGALCNTKAIQPLRVRLQIESTSPTGKPQVRLAISAALRDLGSGQCTP